MRRTISALFGVLVLGAAAAQAQSEIRINADPIPIVDAQINGRAVRLEVDLRMPAGLMLSQEQARRLGVRRVPIIGVSVGVDGSEARIRGRVARPRIVFGNEDSRAFAGIFPVPVTSRADGVIGPGALPHDIVTIVLGPEIENAREIVFTLDEADNWVAESSVGGETLRIGFNVGNPASVFNRSAARRYDASGVIVAAGALVEAPVILGLSTMMQPVTTQLTIEGLALGSTNARTNAPLLGADEPDAIVVEARDSEASPAGVGLGREAMSRCATISVNRATRRLTLRCAP